MDKMGPSIQGHVLIKDKDTGQIILDRKNAIHYQNMSLAIGYSLANQSNGFIHSMAFGNGGSSISGTGAITYFPPNTTDTTSDLYNATYTKIIDGSINNNFTVNHLTGTLYTDIIVTCTLDYNEPSGQAANDSSTITDAYTFDEIGLKTSTGLLLTHVIFNPIQKSLNRLIEVIYTLRIQMI
jgi:hypothetical protein